MDIDIIYTLLVVAVALAGAYLLTKYTKIKKDDLETVKTLFNLSVAVIDELNLKNEDKILEIATIVNSSIDYAIVFSEDNVELEDVAFEYCVNVCKQLNINIDGNRTSILKELIGIASKQIKF
jgi:uncharacterized protein YlxP (DUF503 family)